MYTGCNQHPKMPRSVTHGGSTGIPSKLSQMLSPCKGPLKGSKRPCHPRCGWGGQVYGMCRQVLPDMATAPLRSLPPPTDGVRYLIGDSTRKPQRGWKHPVGHIIRHSEDEPSLCGFALGRVSARWDCVCVPMALGLIAPPCRGHHNILLWLMLQDLGSPTWVPPIGVVAKAGYAANATRWLIAEKPYAMGLRCLGRGNARMANLCALWSHIDQSPVTPAGPATHPMAAGRMMGSVHVTPHKLGDVTVCDHRG